jgi:hypothetical protein
VEYSRKTNLEQLTWLLAFVRADLSRESDGKLLEFVWGVYALRSTEMFEGPRSVNLQLGTYVRLTGDAIEPNRDAVLQLQHGVRAGLDALSAGEEWELPVYPSKWLLVPHPIDKTIRRRYDGDTTTAFYAAAGDLIAESWARIRRCVNPRCNAYYLFDDPRQQYCSRACSDRVRQARLAPHRKRNHPAEHRARVAQNLPPRAAVKVAGKTTRAERKKR